MDESRIKQLVAALVIGADKLAEIAATARRNRKSVGGAGQYADRFHDEVIKLTKVENVLSPILQAIPNFDGSRLRRNLHNAKAIRATLEERDAARREIRLICEAEIDPNLTNVSSPTVPSSEPVLASAVLSKAPTYLQRTLLQANGCYEKRWFEASSVMIRKLVENLIIDVYEHHKRETEIQKDREYLMLAGLINAILNQSHWPLQRETKRALPEIKKLGDSAAHKRRYEATRPDIDHVLAGLRAAVDDLLHLAGHK